MLFVAGASLAIAQNMPGKPAFTDDMVRQVIELALRNIEKGICGATACAPASPEELANPPVTLADGKRAMDVASDSAAAKWCGIANSERIFLGFMGHARHILKYDDRKLSLLALVHGITTRQVERALTSRGSCPPQLKQQLEAMAGQTINRRP